MRTAEYAAPERVLLHLSDTHLRAAGSRLFDLVDARDHLARALTVIESSGISPDGIVFTGDLVDLGEGRGVLGAARARRALRGAPGHPGVLGHGQPRRPRAVPRRACSTRLRMPRPHPSTGVDELDGLRLVTLDTSVPGAPPRRAPRRPARVARRRAVHARTARHDPRDAPPARAERPRRSPRASSCAISPAWPGCCAAPMCARSSPGTCTIRRSRRSPASPSRSRHRPATPRT